MSSNIIFKILESKHFGIHLISILGWIFGLMVFGIKPFERISELASKFNVTAYTITVSLFLLWNLLVEFMDMFHEKSSILNRICIYLLPLVCSGLLVSNGIFAGRYTLIPEEHSIVFFVPLLYLTLLFRELMLRASVDSTKYTISIFLFTTLNCIICLNVNIAWIAWFRSIVS